MSYTNATFFLDYELGSDASRTALTSCTASNPSGNITSIAKTAHGLVTGAVVDLTAFTAWLNAAWKITIVDANNFTLDDAVWQATGDASGTVTPRGGSSLADAWKTITSAGVSVTRHAPGDTIRVKASPDPTSLGVNATWTDGPQQPTKSIVSSTNATPIVITLSGANYTALAPAVGDTVIINGHTTNTNANGVWTISAINGSTAITLQDALDNNSVGNGVGGASGTVRKATNMVVKLASALTKNIALCGNRNTKINWTASTNVTGTTITSDYKEGSECQQVAVAAAFTTGLAAYFATGTLDLSEYQQVSFWVKQTAGTLGAAGAVCLKLCTDVAGATPVHTINVPALGALNQWSPVVVDLAGAMNSAIASIAFVVNTDNGAQTFLIDNVVASKASTSADSLNLTSLIGKNSGTEAWFGIQSINGTRVMLDNYTNIFPGSFPQRGYSGTTETVLTYKRETTKTVMATATGTSIAQFTKMGAPGSLISYSGGWNRTDMTTQTAETWFDGQNGYGTALNYQFTYISVDKINFTRYYSAVVSSGSASDYCVIGSMSVCNCTWQPTQISGAYWTISTISDVQNGGWLLLGPICATTTITRSDGSMNGGVTLGASSTTTTIMQANNNAGNAGIIGGIFGTIGTISAAHGNSSVGYQAGADSVCGSVTANANVSGVSCAGAGHTKILGGSTTANTSYGVNAGNPSSIILRNFTANEGTGFYPGSSYAANGTIYSERNGGVADAHLITMYGGTIISATDQRNTVPGISWKFRPTAIERNILYPLTLSVAKIACAADVAVNVTIYTRRDNTQIQGQLRLPGNQLAGVPSDVTVSCTPTINTWVQSSALTFTPTETGVVEIFFDCWDGVGTTNNMWIDDLVVST